MKTLYNTILFIVLLVFAQGCKSDEPVPIPPKIELEKLPPATQEGKDTFGCLVNGKAWYTISTTDTGGDYQNGSLFIYALVNNPSQDIGLNLREYSGTAPLTTGVYDLKFSLYNPVVTFIKWSFCHYGGSGNDGDLISGKLDITKFDKTSFIVSGKFEFTITHTGCDTVKVTDGRFDIHYAP